MNIKLSFLFFIVFVLMCSTSQATTLAGPDPCNTLDNWTVFYSGTVIEDGAIHLDGGVGDGVGWTSDSFSGDVTASFTYHDYNESIDEYFQVSLNGTLVAGDYGEGWRIRPYETGQFRLYDPNGTYEVFPTEIPFTTGDVINISKNGTHICVLVNDNSAGILEGGGTNGYLEFRTVSAVLGNYVGIDNVIVTDVLQMEVAGETPPDTTPGNTYYVSTTGSDSNDGLSIENAWATANHAVETATVNSIIYFEAGTYDFTSFPSFANNLTIDRYNTGTFTLRGYPQDSNYGNVTITGSGWGTNNVKLTVNNATITQFAEGILSLRSNTSFNNVIIGNASGIIGSSGASSMISLGATSNTAMTNQTITGSTVYDYCMPTPFFPYGSISPNFIGINGDKDTTGISGYITIRDSNIYGQALHAVINLQTQSYNEKYGAGLDVPKLEHVVIDNVTFGPFENRYNSPSTQLAVISANQGPMRYLTANNLVFDGVPGTTTKAIVGNYWDSSFINITFSNVTAHAMLFESLNDDVAGIVIYPKNNTIDNVSELTDSLYGLTIPGGDNFTINDSAFHKIDFNDEVTDITISNQKYVGSVELSFSDAGTGSKDVLVSFDNGRLFTEDHPNYITINTSGSYLDFSTNTGNTEYHINNIGYSVLPATSLTVPSINTTEGIFTSSTSQTITFAELATGNTTDVSIVTGNNTIVFSELDFVSGETELPLEIVSYSPSGSTIDIYNTSTLTTSIDINKVANISVYLDGNIVQTNTSVTTASYVNDSLEVGTFELLMSAYEGSDYANHTWTVVVSEYVAPSEEEIDYNDAADIWITNIGAISITMLVLIISVPLGILVKKKDVTNSDMNTVVVATVILMAIAFISIVAVGVLQEIGANMP